MKRYKELTQLQRLQADNLMREYDESAWYNRRVYTYWIEYGRLVGISQEVA